jgi:hypothetical protein
VGDASGLRIIGVVSIGLSGLPVDAFMISRTMGKTRAITKSPKKRADAIGEAVLVRLQPQLAKPLDVWRRQQDDLPGRPEAIRRLVEIGLKVKQ